MLLARVEIKENGISITIIDGYEIRIPNARKEEVVEIVINILLLNLQKLPK
ncbi:conserved protein of unknown function [Tepidanaerobacter acetatoxydans Re1]|uniref:Uncharacterized protein n=1 Tax=Tepidanaerobacter acetatoxydans (strain DSM 21804 / JCM 16047 / Re1) TaxID=1209989 RepID=F4LXF6_TEPAE|nr:hypothetical protein TepRe1_0883 [Tepidanaerobacter acetatoxydans Re1]CDI40528.1 conserved protein of unknown function [Tepidanaerobacter acetatoxydans Re1]